MARILEKIYGERSILICENNTDKIGGASIKLVGNNKEIETTCFVMLPKQCFSEPNILHVMLPKGIESEELEEMETIEFV